MNIIRKIIALMIIFLFIGTGIASGIQVYSDTKEDNIFQTINSTTDKILISDEIIGDRNVRYWSHVINNIQIKNDFILLHQDAKTDNILKFEKNWRDVEESLFNYEEETFEINNYFWKTKVIFLDKYDCKEFYTINPSQEFPLKCWEVRHNDGTTKIYNLNGEQIGSGIPAPYKGFSLSGFHEVGYPDPWLQWRINADGWFQNWCDSTFSMSHPTPSTITTYITNPEYELFYELAHGGSYYFQADYIGSYYYASDVTSALIARDPMRFAFIGSCGGMDNIGPGNWAYEFRKGEMIDTVVVGYTGMASCPGWSVSIPWQDDMFYAMDEGLTIKEAFDIASSNWPTIAPCVVFTGDVNMVIREEEPGDDDDDDDDDNGGNIPPRVTIIYPQNYDTVNDTINVTGTASDLDGNVKDVYIKIDTNEWQEVEGIKPWNYIWDTTKIEDGEHVITVIAHDGHDYSACVSKVIYIKNNEDEPEQKYPDLTGEGILSWSEIKPKVVVSGEFTIENIGDPESKLDWEIAENPNWGDWTFNPSEGTDLKPEDGKYVIDVLVVVPEETDQSYNGEIKVVNKYDDLDYITIPVSLSTSKNKVFEIFPWFIQFFEQYSRIFQIITYLIEL